MSSVSFKNIEKRYGALTVVHDLNLDVEDGEFLVLVGPSGCGKSTTLRMLAGLESISSGDVFIGGNRINDVHPSKRNISMVFQNYALYPHMNVYNNLILNLKVKGIPKDEIEKRVNYAAGMLSIEDLMDRMPSELSGGQKQRVAVGRSIVRDPEVFLFDEPLSNLDAKLRVQMRAELRELHKNLGATMIYVTHDQVEAMTLGDRIVVMKDGRIQQVAKPMDLYDYPVNIFVAGFIGSPPMNTISGHLHMEKQPRFVSDDGTLICQISPDDIAHLDGPESKNIIMGVRPEHLVPDPSGTLLFSARPTRVEPLGSEFLAYYNVGDISLISKLIEPDFDETTEVPMYAAHGSLHWFDTETGRRFA